MQICLSEVMNILVTGERMLPVAGNMLPVMGKLPVITSDGILVTGSLPITDKPNRSVTGKPFCSRVVSTLLK
jgi:hypothetical protein